MRQLIISALFTGLLAPSVAAGEASILGATILSERGTRPTEGSETSVLPAWIVGEVHQTPAGNGFGMIAQVGRDNAVSQTQAGRNKAIAVQVGSANTATISQSGEANLANTAQYGTGNYASATQQGAYNLTMVEQAGGQAAWVFQRGAFNRLTPDQVPDTPAIILQKGIDADPKIFPLKHR